jgi:hypothetical protein
MVVGILDSLFVLMVFFYKKKESIVDSRSTLCPLFTNWPAIFMILGAATLWSIVVQTLWALFTIPSGIVSVVVPSVAAFSMPDFFYHIMTHKYQHILAFLFIL